MAILKQTTPSSPPPAPPVPGLFVATIQPATTITSALPLPPTDLITATPTHLTLHTVLRGALSPSNTLTLHTHALALCQNTVLALTSPSHISFLSRTLSSLGSANLSPRLSTSLAAHPTRALAAVAEASSISAFPVISLARGATAGRVARIALAGAVLSIAFVGDDGGVADAAVLVALVQEGGVQRVEVFAVREGRIGLVARAVTGVKRWEDGAVARATKGFTGRGEKVRAASAVAAVPGCAFGFVVFAEGRVVLGDARFVLRKGEEARRGKREKRGGAAEDSFGAQADREMVMPEEGQVEVEGEVEDAVEVQPAAGGSGHVSLSAYSAAAGEDLSAATNFPTVSDAVLPALSVASEDSVPLPDADAAVAASASGSRPAHLLESPFSLPARKSLREAGLDPLFSSSLCVPPHLALGVGEGDEGFVTAVCPTGTHRSAGGGDGDVESGLYFVMESGRLYSLRCRSRTRSDGVPSFFIPKPNGASAGLAAPGTDARKLSPYFSLEALGHVGPASNIAALSSDLLFVANDGADGSLRQVTPPSRQGRPYRLAVRQTFLNLAPISDFAVVPSLEKTPCPSFGDDAPAGASSEVATFAADEAGGAESCLLLCSGIGEHGTVRSLTAGAAVSVLGTSPPSFLGCSGMWSLRASRASRYHTFLVVTFAESTGVFCVASVLPPEAAGPVPRNAVPEAGEAPKPSIARLLDASVASKMLLDCRTIACGLLRDGVLAQVHRGGVRFAELQKVKGRGGAAGSVAVEKNDCGEFISGTMVKRTYDWYPPSGMFLTAGCVGAGIIVVSLRQAGLPSRLLQLGIDGGAGNSFVDVISSVVIKEEVCAMHVVEGDNCFTSRTPASDSVLIVATYAPAVEVWSLGGDLARLKSCVIEAWTGDSMPMNTSTGSPRQPRSGILPGATSRLLSEQLVSGASAAESLCSIGFGRDIFLFVGLRDGYLLTYSLSVDVNHLGSDSGGVDGDLRKSEALRFLSRRRLGIKPVRVSNVVVASGSAVIAECERPWLGRLARDRSMNWVPLNFEETNSAAALSCAGAERCIAFLSCKGSLSICSVRRTASVSVQTLRVGETPRRAIALDSRLDFIAVATSSDESQKKERDAYETLRGEAIFQMTANNSAASGSGESNVGSPRRNAVLENLACGRGLGLELSTSDLRIYDFRTKARVCRACFLPGELVHVLLSWQKFLVVGTSSDLRRRCAEGKSISDEGRLLLFSQNVGEPLAEKKELKESCQVVLPGAILAGAVTESGSCMAVSCNDLIFVFTLTVDGKGLCEVARTKTRGVVVSLSMRYGLVCAADRKDSVAFYRVNVQSRRLIRCRGDFRARDVADAVLVDDFSAVATDRHGHIFSLAYDQHDQPRLPLNNRDPELSDNLLRNVMGRLFSERRLSEVRASGAAASSESGFASPPGLVAVEEISGQSGGNILAAPDDEVGVPSEGAPEVAGDVDGMVDEGDSPESSVDEDEGEINEAVNASLADVDDSGDDDEESNDSMPSMEESDSSDESDEDSGVPLAEHDDGDDHSDENDLMADDAGVENAPGAGAVDSLVVHGQQPIQRHLVCNHACNLNDIAVRIRYGSIARRNCDEGLRAMSEAPEASACFWSSRNASAICGTLSGAIIVALPVGRETTSALQRLSEKLVLHHSILNAHPGLRHDRFRSAFGKSMKGCIDGDLLRQYCLLDPEDQLEVVGAAGFSGRKNAELFVELIDACWDRVL